MSQTDTGSLDSIVHDSAMFEMLVRGGRELSGVLLVTLAIGCSNQPALVHQTRDAGSSLNDAISVDASAPCGHLEATAEEVTIDGMVGALGGTLELPAGCVVPPVLLIISGSGTTDRNANVGREGPNTLTTWS